MVFGDWFSAHAFDLISALGVIASLCFTAFSLRSETKTRRIANLLSIAANHRELWKTFLNDKELARVRDASVNLTAHPVTTSEQIFVNLVIQHLNTVFCAMNDELVVKVDGMRRDVAQFFLLPIPEAVWEKLKPLQNDEFVAFVENCRNWK